jgi:hypothetical protein
MTSPGSSQSHRRARLASRVAIAAVCAGAAIFSLPWMAAWQQQKFAEQVAERALRSEGADANSVRRMWTLGLPATASLAQLAAVQRPDVAKAAQEALSDQLAAWLVEFESQGDSALLGKRLELMSGALAANAGRFDAAGQLWARKMARQFVVASDQLAAEQAWPVLAACERTLAVPTISQPSVPTAVSEPGPLTPAVPFSAPAATIASPVSPAREPEASRPGTATIAGPSPPADLSVIMPMTEPLAAGPGANARPIATDNPLRAIEELISPTPTPGAPEVTAAPNVAMQESPGVDVPSPLDMRHARQRLRELSDQELIRLADSSSKFEGAAAREALRSRGYSEELLRLTRELRLLPAAERRQALERGAGLPAADARRLLRWFVADEDAEVRLQALTLLATTGDPRLAEIARERAVEDADPRVAELAAKLMELR